MGLANPQSLITVDEYLARERAAKDRSIYLDGRVFAMAGESLRHGDITFNLGGLLYSSLKGSPCRALTKDTKVRSGPTPSGFQRHVGMYSYPDVLVICGEPEFHDALEDVILNPIVIIEVLSESTETFDRGEKFNRYKRWNPTLQEYLLVSQDTPQIDHYRRKADDTWEHRRHSGLRARVTIRAIHCTLRLADVYDRVKFERK